MIRSMKLSVELVGSARHTTADHCPYDRVPFREVMHCAGWDAGSVPRDICCYCGAYVSVTCPGQMSRSALSRRGESLAVLIRHDCSFLGLYGFGDK